MQYIPTCSVVNLVLLRTTQIDMHPLVKLAEE